MAEIALTKPNGLHYECDPAKIDDMDEPEPGMMAPSVKTVIHVDGQMHGVRETIAEIHAKAKAVGVTL